MTLIIGIIIFLVVIGIGMILYSLFNNQRNQNTSKATNHAGVLTNTKHYRTSHFVQNSTNNNKSVKDDQQSQNSMTKKKSKSQKEIQLLQDLLTQVKKSSRS